MRVVFVTHELEPATPGGAGAVVAELARLQAAAGWEPVVVLGATADPGDASSSDAVVEWCELPPGTGDLRGFMERSQRLAEAVAERVAHGLAPDLIEFHDFDIPAWWALTHREALGLSAIPIALRLHGPVGAMYESIGIAPPPLDEVAVLEEQCFAMADVVLTPSPAMRRWVAERYSLEPARVVVAPVPVPAVNRVDWRPAPGPEFAAYGRLNEVKGSHDLIRAAIPVLDAHPSARLRFVGGDGWSASENRPMSAMLEELIPSRLRGRIVLEGSLPRQEALGGLRHAWAVVIASRFESFCIAAHEARRAGLPVVVPRLAAFEDLGEADGFLVYDGTVPGLESLLGQIAADRNVVERLAAMPAPPTGDPLAGYRVRLPNPRHPRTQAGLATASVKEAERLGSPRPGPGGRMLRGVMRRLPEPLARLVMRLIPRSIKARVRRHASWPAEQARRARQRRLDDLAAAIDRGDFAAVAEPRVSVVIPCFEQGAWVEDAVASVHAQTVDDWEIVLVDDGSSDPETVSALGRLGAWPRITLVRQANRGLSAARNAGMERARGEYLVPLDADDELHPEFLERMLAALQEQPRAAFAHCWAELFGDVEAIWVPRPANPYWQLLSNGIVGCVLLRRSAWEEAGGYDESLREGHEDWDLWVRLQQAGWEQVRVDAPLFRYRKHGVSMSVGSEVGFERALHEMARRHPRIYEPEQVAAAKEEWYPLLSALVGRSVDRHDVQPVEATASLEEAVARCRGKYVADLRGQEARVDEAVALADRLESFPNACWASDDGGTLAVWRRWCLVDPDATPGGGIGAAGVEGLLHKGRFPDPAWMVDPESVPPGAIVSRQRPEEAGRVPRWMAR